MADAPIVNDALKTLLWRQFGGSLDMLENAIARCPESLWGDRSRQPEYWAMAFHVLFWLDYYLSPPGEDFRPPEPFGLEEMDPAGVLPPRVYTKDELLGYLGFLRGKLRDALAGLDPTTAARPRAFRWGSASYLEVLLYNMRHVQHHAGQLNLLMRLGVDDAPGWVGITKHAGPA
jgi:hypothetical protein